MCCGLSGKTLVVVVGTILVVVVLVLGASLGSVFGKQCEKKSQDCLPFALDMAPDSVDDMYNNCEVKMKKKIENEFLQNEKNKDKNFKEAWNKAEKYYNSKWANNNTPLKKEQIMAAHAYTLEEPALYCDFNNAVRKQNSEYKTTFQYHTLHFYLTMALRTIKPTADKCVKVFRRTNCKFRKDVQNKEIRLSAFSSSSMGDYSDPEFGTKSCFEITTCFGASISKFSKFPDEREVLIPPYEVFKVTAIKENSEKNKLPCEVVYTLESTKTTQSNLNCALI